MIRLGRRGMLSGFPPVAVSRVLTVPRNADTGSMTCVAGTAYAMYVGSWGSAISSMDVGYYTHSLAALGAGWAELGIATGPVASQVASNSLTVRGFVSVDTEVKLGTTTVRTATVGSLSIGAGENIWLIVGGSHATTQASYRIAVVGDRDVMGYACARADAASTTTRPSLNIGTARDFTGTPGTGFAVPVLWGVVPG